MAACGLPPEGLRIGASRSIRAATVCSPLRPVLSAAPALSPTLPEVLGVRLPRDSPQPAPAVEIAREIGAIRSHSPKPAVRPRLLPPEPPISSRDFAGACAQSLGSPPSSGALLRNWPSAPPSAALDPYVARRPPQAVRHPAAQRDHLSFPIAPVSPDKRHNLRCASSTRRVPPPPAHVRDTQPESPHPGIPRGNGDAMLCRTSSLAHPAA